MKLFEYIQIDKIYLFIPTGAYVLNRLKKAYNLLSINIIMINSTKYNKISVYIRKDEKAVIEEKALMEGVSISRYLVLAALHNDLNFEKSRLFDFCLFE